MESASPKPECRYCGNAHDVKELCRPRRVGRRSFLMALGAAAAGVAAAAKANVGAITAETLRLFNAKMMLSAGMPRQTIFLVDTVTMREYLKLTEEDRRYARPPIVGAIRDVEVPDVLVLRDNT